MTAVDVVVENFAWRPERGRGPITLGGKAYFDGPPGAFVSFTAVFDERVRPPKRRYEFQAQQVELARLDPLYERSLPVRVVGGTLSLSAQIVQEGEALRGEATLVLTGARLEGRSDDFSLLGFDPAASRRILEGLNAYAKECPLVLSLRVAGTAGRLEWRWDDSLLRAAKRGLLWLGTLPFAPILGEIDEKLLELQASELVGGSVGKLLEGFLQGQLGIPGADPRCGLEEQKP